MSDSLDATRIRKYVDQAASELGIRMDGNRATAADRQAVVAKAMGWIMDELEDRIAKVELARQGATLEQRRPFPPRLWPSSPIASRRSRHHGPG